MISPLYPSITGERSESKYTCRNSVYSLRIPGVLFTSHHRYIYNLTSIYIHLCIDLSIYITLIDLCNLTSAYALHRSLLQCILWTSTDKPMFPTSNRWATVKTLKCVFSKWAMPALHLGCVTIWMIQIHAQQQLITTAFNQYFHDCIDIVALSTGNFWWTCSSSRHG